MENDLIQVKENQNVTTSLLVAEKFNKNHAHILRAIEDLIVKLEENPFLDSPILFEKSNYSTSQNKSVPMYFMNRDGFTLLAMGFNNTPIVLEWKLKYIKAFNEMEKKLNSPTLTDNRLEIARLISRTPKGNLSALLKLYPEYFSDMDLPGSLESVVNENTSYTSWIESYGINTDWIGHFPTSDIFNNYMRFCIENRLNSMGKKTFYRTLENDFNLIKKQYTDGRRYFISA